MLLPSPVTRISNFSNQNVTLILKRDDLIHPEFGGNKWRKLKYNLTYFKSGNYEQLVTFGGPFSNHIAATASVCKYYGIKSVGIIRGSHLDHNNPTLKKASSDGMTLIPLSKESYRLKMNSPEVVDIISQFSHPFILPEGGTNHLAIKGTSEIMTELNTQASNIDLIFTPVGTGGTAAGIIAQSNDNQFIHVINSMKNQGLEKELSDLVQDGKNNWNIIHDYHFGGFAKTSEALIQFINSFYSDYGVPLDPVYTGKMLFAVHDLLNRNEIDGSKKIAVIHTGGLQGITAFNYLQSRKQNPLLLRTI